jgi:hypothetical protein
MEDTEATGERVLDEAVRAARRVFGRRLEAAFALGSLAHGGFAPQVSDVDLALVVREVGPATRLRLYLVRWIARRRCGPGPADRLSVFWGRWSDVHRGAADGVRLPPVDRLDLLEHGRLLAGTDRRAGAVPPTADDLVLDGATFTDRLYDDAHVARLRTPADLLAAGARLVTKAVLFPVRFLWTLHTGLAGANADAVRWYTAEHRGAHAPLVEAAGRWRHDGVHPGDAVALDLLATHLLPLQREFLAAYRTWLSGRGWTAQATRFAEIERALAP